MNKLHPKTILQRRRKMEAAIARIRNARDELLSRCSHKGAVRCSPYSICYCSACGASFRNCPADAAM